jgi:hypothetical protein
MRLLSRSLPLVLLALVLATGARAQQVDRVEIVQWGIYRTDRLGDVDNPRSPTGTSYIAANIRLQSATTTIPALVGLTLGFYYKAIGAPPGARVVLKYVIRFPRQGLTNPATGRTFRVAEFESSTVVGGLRFEGYTFDYDWEVETGPWTLEIWHGDRRLAEKTFIVTRLISSAGQKGLRTVR